MSDDWKEFKNPTSSYPDWNVYNHPSGQKQGGRFLIDTLQCENRDCISRGRGVSEHEAFYLFSKQSFLKRVSGAGSLYVCPYCGGKKMKPFAGLDYRTA